MFHHKISIELDLNVSASLQSNCMKFVCVFSRAVTTDPPLQAGDPQPPHQGRHRPGVRCYKLLTIAHLEVIVYAKVN
jgi:hypothetical protein